MKEVDVSNCILVHAGQPWEYEQQPCSKDMIPHLERKENYCSWFQPMNGTVDDQFPAILIGSKYYLLSLRVQKAVFRHIRLRRGFVNREFVPDGQLKLRIPQPLLLEKRRTAKRFMLMRARMGNSVTVDPRESKNAAVTGQVTAESFIIKTIIPFFMSVWVGAKSSSGSGPGSGSESASVSASDAASESCSGSVDGVSDTGGGRGRDVNDEEDDVDGEEDDEEDEASEASEEDEASEADEADEEDEEDEADEADDTDIDEFVDALDFSDIDDFIDNKTQDQTPDTGQTRPRDNIQGTAQGTAQGNAQGKAMIPNLDRIDPTMPSHTTFGFDEHETVLHLITQLEQDCPSMTKTKSEFLRQLGDVYDARYSSLSVP